MTDVSTLCFTFFRHFFLLNPSRYTLNLKRPYLSPLSPHLPFPIRCFNFKANRHQRHRASFISLFISLCSSQSYLLYVFIAFFHISFQEALLAQFTKNLDALHDHISRLIRFKPISLSTLDIPFDLLRFITSLHFFSPSSSPCYVLLRSGSGIC